VSMEVVAPMEFVVYGWDGASRFDASALVTAASHAEAAEIFMRTYPFDPRSWDPHRLRIERLDRSDLRVFEVRSLDPLVIEGTP